MKVIHITTGLQGTGGAQTMLYRLISRTGNTAFRSEVISLTGTGSIGEKIQALGVPVRSLRMGQWVPNSAALLRLVRWLRRSRPNVIQTWMYHADLIGGLAARLAGRIPVVWGVHHTDLDPQIDKRTTIWTAKACARLSGVLPDKIVCCSQAGRQVHTRLGYSGERMMVIPNGFDLKVFKPDPEARRAVRRELGIDEDAPVIGLVARFHPQKDHANFIEAAARFHACVPESRFVLCGESITPDNLELVGLIESSDIQGQCHLLGTREDIPRVMTAFDVATCSSSHGEAFPLVIGEAMACGVPCVVTDVGDAATIVGGTGVVVPPRDAPLLTAAWGQLLLSTSREQRSRMGLEARQRIMDNYSLEEVAEQYERVYRSLAI